MLILSFFRKCSSKGPKFVARHSHDKFCECNVRISWAFSLCGSSLQDYFWKDPELQLHNWIFPHLLKAATAYWNEAPHIESSWECASALNSRKMYSLSPYDCKHISMHILQILGMVAILPDLHTIHSGHYMEHCDTSSKCRQSMMFPRRNTCVTMVIADGDT